MPPSLATWTIRSTSLLLGIMLPSKTNTLGPRPSTSGESLGEVSNGKSPAIPISKLSTTSGRVPAWTTAAPRSPISSCTVAATWTLFGWGRPLSCRSASVITARPMRSSQALAR